jgi:prohibitin 2
MSNVKGQQVTGWLVFSVFLFVIFLVLLGCFFVVQAGERGIVFNKITGMKNTVYGEGMHLKFPLLDKAIKMNVRVQKQEEDASAASKDLQDVNTKVAVNFYVDQTKLLEIYRQIGQSTGAEDYMQSQIMNPIIQESVKQATARYTAEELISKRPLVKEEIDATIRERMSNYGIIVRDVSITNFQFSVQFTKAIEDKVSTFAKIGQEQNQLEIVKIQAQQKIAEATGSAEAIRIINEQLLKSPQYVDYLMIQKWDSHLPLSLGSGSILSITGGTK